MKAIETLTTGSSHEIISAGCAKISHELAIRQELLTAAEIEEEKARIIYEVHSLIKTHSNILRTPL